MDQYQDIIDLPHHGSKTRTPMSMIDRGAQFSPFAALTGYDGVIAESARLTQEDVELSDGAIARLDEILRELCERIGEQPFVRFTCFQPDERKSGGAYVRVEGNLKKYDYVEKRLILTDGRAIEIESILDIETA